MPTQAGSMNQQVQFLRRIVGSYQPLGPVQWGRLQFERATTINVAGMALQARSGRLKVRSCDLTHLHPAWLALCGTAKARVLIDRLAARSLRSKFGVREPLRYSAIITDRTADRAEFGRVAPWP